MNKYVSWSYMKKELKLYKWLPIIILIVNFMSFVFLNSNNGYKLEYIKLISSFSVLLFPVFFVLGIMQFKYINNKPQLDFVHSLPIKREKILVSKFLSGLILVIVPYIISIIIFDIAVNVMIQNVVQSNFSISSSFSHPNFMLNGLLHYTVKQIATGVLVYTFSIFVSLITGSVVFQILGALVIFFTVPITTSLLSIIQQTYNKSDNIFFTINYTQFSINSGSAELVTNVSIKNYNNGILMYNPLLGHNNPMVNIYSYKKELFIIYVVSSIALLLLSIFVYKMRKSENATIPISFYRLRVFFQTLICFEGGLIATSMFTGDFGLIAMTFNAILGAIFTFFVTEILLNKSVSNIFKRKLYIIPPIIYIIVAILLVTI